MPKKSWFVHKKVTQKFYELIAHTVRLFKKVKVQINPLLSGDTRLFTIFLMGELYGWFPLIYTQTARKNYCSDEVDMSKKYVYI